MDREDEYISYAEYPPSPHKLGGGDVERIFYSCIPFPFLALTGWMGVISGILFPILYYFYLRNEQEERWRNACDKGYVLHSVDNDYLMKYGWYCNGIGQRPFRITYKQREEVYHKRAEIAREKTRKEKELAKQKAIYASRIERIRNKIKNFEPLTEEDEAIVDTKTWKHDPRETDHAFDGLHRRYDVKNQIWLSDHDIKESEFDKVYGKNKNYNEIKQMRNMIYAYYTTIAKEYGCKLAKEACSDQDYFCRWHSPTYDACSKSVKDKLYEHWLVYKKLQDEYKKRCGYWCTILTLEQQLELEEKIENEKAGL